MQTKLDPTNDYMVAAGQDIEEWIGELLNKVRQDDRDRGNWIRRTAHFVKRRLCKEFREEEWPWPNASTIVIPTMDWTIERQKPPLIQSTLGVNPVITLRSRNPNDLEKIADTEALMDWMMDSAIVDSADQVSYAADDFCQYGFAVIQTYYDYRVRFIRTVIHRDRLPIEIARLFQMAVSEDDADGVFQTAQVPLLSKRELRQLRPELEQALAFHFNLKPDVDDDDRDSLSEIVEWLFTDKPTLTIRTKEVVTNTPRFKAVKPEHFIVSPAISDLQEARRICVRRFYTMEEILERKRSQKWNAEATKELLDHGPVGRSAATRSGLEDTIELAKTQAYDSSKRTLSGSDGDFDLFEVWEIYTYRTLNEKYGPERVVMWVDPQTQLLLRFMTLPFEHAEWPFVQIRYEYVDQRFYRSRSVCEKIDDLDVEITRNHRDAINARTITAAPVFLYRQSSMVDPEEFHFIPGEFYPVQDTGDVVPLSVPPKELSYMQEESNLLSYLERYSGILDSSLTDQQGLTRPRTATEISALGNLQGQIAGSRLLMWHRGWAKVYRQLHNLWVQYGPEEIYVRVTGGEADSFKRLTRYEVAGDFDFVPTPAALNNPFTRTQEAQLQLQTLLQVSAQPGFLGMRYEIDGGVATEAYLQSIDSRRSRLILKRLSDEEVQQKQQAMQEQMAAQQAAESGVAPGVPQELAGLQGARPEAPGDITF